MNRPVSNGPPSPEEFQRQLAEFMRHHFQPARRATGCAARRCRRAGESRAAGKADQFEFKYKPREVKDYLDRFVIKQDDAKKVLSVALCDHYHHVRLALEGKESAELRQAEHHPHRPHRCRQDLPDSLRGRPDWRAVRQGRCHQVLRNRLRRRRRRGHGARPVAPGRRRRDARAIRHHLH